jgi:farnesyl diphosphate synthase
MSQAELDLIVDMTARLLRNTSYDEEYVRYLMPYMLSGGKYVRLKVYLKSLELLGHEATDEDRVVGWCIEMLHAYFLISDDIADNSEMRRGQPCLHIGRGMRAARDAHFILAALVKLLGGRHSEEIRSLFFDAAFKTLAGQTQDTLAGETKDRGMRSTSFSDAKKLYSMERYRGLVDCKTSVYSIYLPIALTYMVSGRPVPETLWRFSSKAGFYFQFKDDTVNYLPSVSGKTGNDLEEKKVTWYTCSIVESAATEEDRKDIMSYLLDDAHDGIYPKIQRLLSRAKDVEEEMVRELREIIDASTKECYTYLIELLRSIYT